MSHTAVGTAAGAGDGSAVPVPPWSAVHTPQAPADQPPSAGAVLPHPSAPTATGAPAPRETGAESPARPRGNTTAWHAQPAPHPATAQSPPVQTAGIQAVRMPDLRTVQRPQFHPLGTVPLQVGSHQPMNAVINITAAAHPAGRCRPARYDAHRPSRDAPARCLPAGGCLPTAPSRRPPMITIPAIYPPPRYFFRERMDIWRALYTGGRCISSASPNGTE